MPFKENILKKISIDRLTQTVTATLGSPDGNIRLDKDAMRQLLDMSPFQHRKERDLDLYIDETGQDAERILVLDNELPIYRTTVDDVAMRKSPYIKEMVNIRNIVKILRDSDVKISRKEDSLAIVERACLAQLDLSYSESDIETIAYDGAGSLESRYAEGVLESLAIFAELLDLQPAPKPFRLPHHTIYGSLAEPTPTGALVFGPIVIYSMAHNTLKLIDAPVDSSDRDQMDTYRRVLEGQSPPAIEGTDVFKALKRKVMDTNRSGSVA